MAEILSLTVSEAVRVDSQRIAGIMAELGDTAAQHVIGLALEQLATILTTTEAALAAGDLARTVADSEHMARLAWQIGLLSLAGVAMDLGSTAERGDLPALAAIRARLQRVGNLSLTAIWDRAAIS
ncbi:hypothetical protein [Paracoccus sp. JM45]|uniref:hypothetical protein n=1 Tax=Paracoccus sp. JM45 TaxID=2283626 RepID=UPI000E6C003F|nr:hypothetical protein [Paracoccus sp. JM45]RJE81010.1 hypothetical protein DWB67_05320 [Paracoccus sp. JM45]